jgi:hypothetical protein
LALFVWSPLWPWHKGFPAKYTRDVISNTWRVVMVTQKHEGTPGEWLWTTFSFVIFIFHYVRHFLKLSFLRNTSFRRTDQVYISRKCRAITKENMYGR